MTEPSEAPSPLGAFITFEGGEGAGKSTQIERIRARLAAGGRSVVVTREPGGSQPAERIRSIILEGKAKPLKEMGEAILFAAARLDHVETLIRPALRRGQIVLCDRFVDSTRVYQGAVAGIDRAFLTKLEEAATVGTMPNVTFVIDVSVPVGLERARLRREARGEQPDRFEAESVLYHERVRSAFLDVAEAEPDRCVVIDGGASADEVSAEIWSALGPRIPGGVG